MSALEKTQSDNSTLFEAKSFGSLIRMTTVRRVFESFDFEIGTKTFKDLYDALSQRRDMSEQTLRSLYEQKMNLQLKEGQQLAVSTRIFIDDCYEQLQED